MISNQHLGRRRLAFGGPLTATFVAVVAAFSHSAFANVATAARDADVAAVKKLIASGSDVNVPEADGSSALLWAAYQSSPELVSTLLAAGANPNAANNFGVTPLLQASRYGDAATIAALLKGGADFAAATRDGETPLMAAARSGSVESVKLLLEKGADPNAVDALAEQTALMWATKEGHLGVVDALLSAGADPNMKSRVVEITKRVKADYPTGGFSALMWAVRDGNEPIIRRLLQGGADINLMNGDGASAMMLAIVNDRFDLAATLLELGADPKLDDSLYQAVEMHDATTDWRAKDGTRLRADHDNKLTSLDLIKLLLEHGADPNKTYAGQLHSASMCCDTKGVGTPFYRAAIAADVEGMKLMIAHGADLEWAPKPAEAGNGQAGPPGGGNAGKTPLMVAANGGKGVGMAGGPGDIREGAKPPFREISNREPVDAVKLLLEAGANPNAKTPAGDTALHWAAFDGKPEIVRALVAGGADMNVKDASGKTALQVVEGMAPRPPPNTTAGAAATYEIPAQPAEIAALLKELARGTAQASATEGSSK
jgi:ankyrin repeat protein